MTDYNVLGRKRYVADPRDKQYPIRASVTDDNGQMAIERGWRYWWQDGWWGDQWYTPQCVAYAWTHWLEDGPVTQGDRTPNRKATFGQGNAIVSPQELYDEAQQIDEWPGTDYDGTSVRAGAKVLHKQGLIREYRWSWDTDEIVQALLTEGPVVVGTNWYESMMDPDADGFMTVDARGPVYGHAYLLNGVNLKTGMVRLKNSWGRGWGNNGYADMRISALNMLIRDLNGEACLAIEKE